MQEVSELERDAPGAAVPAQVVASGPRLAIRPIGAHELDGVVEALARILAQTVDAGASLGFLPPLQRDEACAYWRSLRDELRAGSRLLLVALADGTIVGTGQLALSVVPAMRHTAQVQKLIVAPSMQGRGVGQALLAVLHDAAWRRGRCLLTLGTRRGGPPEVLYRRLGYREVGVIPGNSTDAAGRRHDTVMLYRELGAHGPDSAAGAR